MIPYTERDTDLALRPPYQMEGVEACLAIRGIKWSVAQAWVNKTLNWRPEGAAAVPFFVAFPLAFVTFMRIRSMRSLDPDFLKWGTFSESEMHVTLMLCKYGADGLPDLLNPSFYPVVLCVDSSPALIAGRESFGFPKIFGEVEISPHRCEARTEVLATLGDPCVRKRASLVTLARIGASPADTPAEENIAFRKALSEMVSEKNCRETAADFEPFPWSRIWSDLSPKNLLERIPAIFASLLPDHAEFVFLRQFRSTENARVASLREVVGSKVTFENLTQVRRETGDWFLEVPDHHSSSLLTELGITSGPIPAPLRANFGFHLPLGETLWSSHP